MLIKIIKWYIRYYRFFSTAYFVAFIQVFFGAFEAVIQAFVITMLVTTYLSIETQEEGEGGGHEQIPHKEKSSNEFEGAL